MKSAPFWFGPEVEGRLNGVYTLFIRDISEECLQRITAHMHTHGFNNFGHVYFTIEAVSAIIASWTPASPPVPPQFLPWWQRIRDLLGDSRCAVTLEVNHFTLPDVPVDLRRDCHLIYRLNVELLHYLKETDSIALDAKDYDVRLATLHTFLATKPDDYRVDTLHDDRDMTVLEVLRLPRQKGVSNAP